MAQKKRRKKKGHGGLWAVVIILALAAGGLYVYRDTLKATAETKAAEAVVVQQLTNYGLSKQQAQQIVDSVDEEDKHTMIRIAEKAVDADTVQKAAQLAQSGDTDQLQQLAQEKLTQQDIDQLEQIAEKYAPGVLQEAGQ